MAERRERTVEELYNATGSITQPEITPVLRGSYQMQGPADETKHDIEKNMVFSPPETNFGKCSMRKKVRMRGESGTCNVCSAPCSSCMHLNRALMGSKTEEFSDESCRVNVASQYSVNESGTLSSLRSIASDSLQHTTSETSNLLSVNSSHDSLSENADSKATLRSSVISDASEDLEMLPKSTSGGGISEDQLSSNPQCVLDQRTFSNKYDEIKGVECHDDNISCVSRPNDANAAVSNHNRNINGSTPSVSSLALEGSWKATQSNKLGSSEILSSKDANASSSSPKVRSPYSHAHSCKSLSCNTKFSGLEETPSFDIQDKAPECSMENINSAKEAAPDIASAQKSVAYKGSLIGGRSDVSMINSPKSEAEAQNDIGDPSDETLKASDQVDHNDKSNELVELPAIQGPPLPSVSRDEGDESDIVEQDVKVCDICGDAGREDLLAICSRCSDGAEHTYCMREMLKKVPEGDWLCEECKFAEESESQKQGSELEDKRTNKVGSSTHVSGKRRAENMEVASAKRQELDVGTGSPKPSSPSGIISGSPKPLSPTRPVALSRDSSFKCLDKGKLKSAHQASFGNLAINDILETARSPTTGPRLQTPKGTLLKSNSFNTLNSKPKVKPVDEVPQKQKGSREHTSIDTKEGPARRISKSMSFKYATSGRTNASESKVKMLPSKFTPVRDLKASKQAKERGTFERNVLSKLDRPLVSSTTASSTVSTPKVDQKLASRGETCLPSFGSNSRESKVVQSDGKLSLSKVTSSLGRKVLEIPVTSVGASSTSGMCSPASEQKLSPVGSKDELLSNASMNAERPSNNADGTVPDGLPLSEEKINQCEKTGESPSICSRPTATTASKAVFCQKCKDTGHATEFCTSGTPQASGIDVSAARSSRVETRGGNKLKAAIDAAWLRRPEFFRTKKVLDQPDELSVSSTDLNCEIASQDQSIMLNKSKSFSSSEGTRERQAILGSSTSDSCKQTTVNGSKQFALPPTDPFLSGVGVSDSTIVSVEKPTIGEFHSQASTAMSVLLRTSAIPEYESIWQGGFEVHRGGKVPDLCGGIQAHLSTCASPKVLEVVNKFPHKIPLHEVPRLSAWPSQFYEIGAKEDNIALYFFAKDLESYERNYKSLLDCMIKNDLALKGNFDGVELLIFSSNQLPEKSQRWNMLFFLWGVFRGRRVNCTDSLKKLHIPSLNVVPLEKDIPPAIMTLSENLCLPRFIDEDLPACDRSCNKVLTSNSPTKTCATVSEDFKNNITSLEQMGSGYQENSEQQDIRFDSNSTSKIGTSRQQLSQKMRCSSPSLKEPSLLDRLDAELKTSLQASGKSGSNNGDMTMMHLDDASDRENKSSLKILPIGNKEVGIFGSVAEDKRRVKINEAQDQVKLERELKEDVEFVEYRAVALGRDLANHRKRPYLDLSEKAPQTSTGASPKMPWNQASTMSVHGESGDKRLKAGFGAIFGHSDPRVRNSGNYNFVSQVIEPGHCSSFEEKKCDDACDEKVILEDLGSHERFFFPVESRRVKDFGLRDSADPWKKVLSDDEVKLHGGGFPNLELALGAETKPASKGLPPFLVGALGKNSNEDRPLDRVTPEDGEGVSASLSLSLSFPFPDKEQTVKPVSKAEQLLPERPNLNDSLYLFGDYRGK